MSSRCRDRTSIFFSFAREHCSRQLLMPIHSGTTNVVVGFVLRALLLLLVSIRMQIFMHQSRRELIAGSNYLIKPPWRRKQYREASRWHRVRWRRVLDQRMCYQARVIASCFRVIALGSRATLLISWLVCPVYHRYVKLGDCDLGIVVKVKAKVKHFFLVEVQLNQIK